jgi:ankyrin repeat protein
MYNSNTMNGPIFNYIVETEDLNTIDEIWGITRLHDAVQKHDMDQITRLLESGADPNIPDALDHLPLNYGGSYPLHYAVEQGSVEIVELLLKYGANPNLRNGDQELPIEVAQNQRSYKLATYDRIIDLLK